MKNEKNADRFFEKETPEYLEIRGGEIRLYPNNQRLSISKLPWIDDAGETRMGKTVTINLFANRENAPLIDLLKRVISMLEVHKADQPEQKQ